MKQKLEEKELNPTVVWKMRKKRLLDCTYCKPNQNENAKRPKIKMRGWKDKLKRKKQFIPLERIK